MQPSTNGRKWLSEISTKAKSRPSSMILYGVPGIGKTSFAAQIPGVVFLIDGGEDGIHQLKDAGLVPDGVPVFPAAQAFTEALEVLEELRTGEHDYKALAIDALGGFERMCHEYVCHRDFGGDWGEKGFVSYQRGYDIALATWKQFINALDGLRSERQMRIVLLAHAKISPFRNPEGPDFDRYNVDVHHKTWALTHRWADMVLFANYEVAFSAADETKKKAKARGGQTRIMHCEHHAAWDAKNRHNLPDEIDMGSSAAEAWANLVEAVKKGRKV